MATSQGVHKTRSLRRGPPSEQVQKDLESLRAKPWDPKHPRKETDHFVFPPLGRLSYCGRRAGRVRDPHFCGCASVADDADLDDLPEIDQLPDELFKRPLEEVTGPSGAQGSTSRPRLMPPPTLERKRGTSEVKCPKRRQSFSGFPQSFGLQDFGPSHAFV